MLHVVIEVVFITSVHIPLAKAQWMVPTAPEVGKWVLLCAQEKEKDLGGHTAVTLLQQHNQVQNLNGKGRSKHRKTGTMKGKKIWTGLDRDIQL